MRNTETKVSVERGIPFTQYIRPNGHTEPVFTTDPLYTDDVLKKAQAILDHGFTFGVEHLTTGSIAGTIEDLENEVDVGVFVCDNDKSVPAAIVKMINDFQIPQEKDV